MSGPVVGRSVVLYVCCQATFSVGSVGLRPFPVVVVALALWDCLKKMCFGMW